MYRPFVGVERAVYISLTRSVKNESRRHILNVCAPVLQGVRIVLLYLRPNTKAAGSWTLSHCFGLPLCLYTISVKHVVLVTVCRRPDLGPSRYIRNCSDNLFETNKNVPIALRVSVLIGNEHFCRSDHDSDVLISSDAGLKVFHDFDSQAVLYTCADGFRTNGFSVVRIEFLDWGESTADENMAEHNPDVSGLDDFYGKRLTDNDDY